MMRTAVFKTIAVLCVFFTGCAVRYCTEPLYMAENEREIVNDTLVAHINIDRSMYAKSGFPIGFQFMVLTSMADSIGVTMRIDGSRPDSGCWYRLANGYIDIVVKNIADSINSFFDRSFVRSMPYRDYEMVVRSGDMGVLRTVNKWLGFVQNSNEWDKMQDRFFRPYDLAAYIKSGRMTPDISPYDDIVKKYSAVLGWDWKLLSAVIFQESRFFMGAVSERGAIGLMQVLESTAKSFGIEDLYNPEENIKAGVACLARLKGKYESLGMDSLNVVKFTLASYNAGESRISDCINFTNSLGKNFHNWDDVAESIPLMREPEYYQSVDFLKHGKFIGSETIRYVEEVLGTYALYESAVI